MHLKKLVLLGFKSFADKIVLHFDAGITCIVGPNGCGKSNIADAFRWVLGEQSAKSMRGSKMPDVIFAGTAHRKPLNFAEVSLVLTEVQGNLPIEYEEVTITRRLHRSGESQYLLNGQTVRLKDLQTLFIGSGIGHNAFSIFEQGKLDQVINDTPLERRYIFEEAAGILRFLQQKKEALKRLEQADLNLSRIQDIYLEVEKQSQELETQAQKAKLFKKQKVELETLEKTSDILRWQDAKKKQYHLQIKYDHQKKYLEECQQKGNLYQLQSQEYKKMRQQHEKSLHNQSEQVLTLRGQKEIQLHERQSIQQRFKENQQRLNKLEQELDHLISARQIRQETLTEIEYKRQQIESEWNEIEKKWIYQQDYIKRQEKDLIHLRQKLEEKQRIHFQYLQQHIQWQSDLKQSEIHLENFTKHEKQLTDRLQQLKINWQKLLQIRQEKKQYLEQLSTLIDHHKNRLNQYEEELKQLILMEEEKQQENEAVQRKMMEKKARQNVLLRMRDEREDFSAAGKRLLQETQDIQSPFYQKLRPLYEFFNPQSVDAVEALAVVLRPYFQTIVIEKEQDANNLLAFAEQLNLQDFSLLCIEWLQKFQGRFSHTQQSLFSKVSPNQISQYFLESVALKPLQKDILALWLEGKCHEGWSSQGVFFDHRGVLFKVKPNENQFFIRESELNQLEKELKNKEGQLKEIEQVLQHIQHQRCHVHLKRNELDQILRQDEMNLIEVNFGLQRILSDQEKNKNDLTRDEQDLIALKQNLEKQKKIYESLQQGFIQSQQELKKLQQEKEALQEELSKKEEVLQEQEQEQRTKDALYRKLAENRQQIIHQYNLLEAKEQDYKQNAQRIENGIIELKECQIGTIQKEKEIQQHLTCLKNQIQEALNQYTILEQQKNETILRSEQIDQQLASQQKEIKNLEREVAQIEVQLSHQQAACQTIVQSLIERYHLTMEEALHIPLPPHCSLEQTDKQIKYLRQSIQDNGNVNLTAIEDLEKCENRQAFLKQQIEDMQHSKKEVLNIIQQLDKESHTSFKETFEAIRMNFRKNFHILFNGGEADLHFTQSQDILEAGIEISAKPPGKQMRSINLLSGGEKCLTAIALLFAFFEVKPAPFCILDEIDAPLDDMNVERFLKIVKHFTDRCQFLIITHNKRTMTVGDILFGISMEEKGVSKLLTLEFAHKETPEVSLISQS